MHKKFKIDVAYDPAHISVRSFVYPNDPDDADLAAVLWIGNENAGQEADAMLSRTELNYLIDALINVRDGLTV